VPGENKDDLLRLTHSAPRPRPRSGHYLLTADGKAMTCSLHGSALAPRQRVASAEQGTAGKLLHRFGGMTATLTFLEDGLHAVVAIDRK
jgi:hypothetical protein